MRTLQAACSLLAASFTLGCGPATDSKKTSYAASQPVSTSSAAAALPLPPKPGYVLRDAGRYGYERALNEEDLAKGKTANPLLMFAYNGEREGVHQLIPMSDQDMKSTGPAQLLVFEWKAGDEFVKQSVFRNGKFREKQFVRASSNSVVGQAMLDAERGFLQRYAHRGAANSPGYFVYCRELDGCRSEAPPKARP